MPSMTRKPSTAGSRRQAVAEQVYDAVEGLLAAGESYTELSVQRIIDAAGVARSTFYAHFPDKSHLLRGLADRMRQDVYELGDAWTRMDNSLPGLVQTFEKAVAFYRAHKPLLAAINQTAVYEPSLRDFFSSGLESFQARVIEHLRERQAAGLTDPVLDAVKAARIIVVGGAQAIADHIERDDGSGDSAFARELAMTWWFGAYSRPVTQVQ
jgi:AcrR family transcriptional regulator